jgi:hypothetical protein
MSVTYIQALGNGYPLVQAHCIGDGSVYEDIVWDGGDPIPSKEDLDIYILAAEKAEMWRLIQIERERRKFGGVNVGGNWFHSDDTSRIQQIGLVLMGSGLPPGIMWKTMSGSFVEMTPTLASQIFQGTAAKDIAIFSVAEQHRAAMNASATPTTYNYLTGSPAWPAIYGE